ncbi:hypothetical protein KHQ82_10595 [Mycoplasmatota bacterium]|nr:hypothetical protein KHQ82_10595 [Mycoplasmatota bacterium]
MKTQYRKDKQFMFYHPISIYDYLGVLPCEELIKRAAVAGYFSWYKFSGNKYLKTEGWNEMNPEVKNETLLKVKPIINWGIDKLRYETCQCVIDRVFSASMHLGSNYSKGIDISLNKIFEGMEEWDCTEYFKDDDGEWKPKPKPEPPKPDVIPIPEPTPVPAPEPYTPYIPDWNDHTHDHEPYTPYIPYWDDHEHNHKPHHVPIPHWDDHKPDHKPYKPYIPHWDHKPGHKPYKPFSPSWGNFGLLKRDVEVENSINTNEFLKKEIISTVNHLTSLVGRL